jgi:hypothetical protein
MLIKEDSVYRLGDFIVMPLTDQDLIATTYLRLKQEGLLQRFYSGIVPSLSQFMSYCLSNDSMTLACFRPDLDTSQNTFRMGGLGMISQPIDMGSGVCKCEVSEVFFREYQKRAWTQTWCRLMLQYIFDKLPISVVYGTTPEHNRAALLFMKSMGFQSMKEPIPHYSVWDGKECGCYVSWMSRDRWSQVSGFSDSELRDNGNQGESSQVSR